MSATTPIETKKQALLEVAARLFYAQGFHATGIKQIIEVAGIAKGTFYSHFKSKDEVGLAWLKHRHFEWNQMLENSLRSAGASPRDQLLGLFEFLADWMDSCSYRGCAFLNALSEVPDPKHPMRVEIREHKEDLHSRIRHLVTAHFEDRLVPERKQIADQIFILFEGAIVESQNFNDSWPILAARRQLEATL